MPAEIPAAFSCCPRPQAETCGGRGWSKGRDPRQGPASSFSSPWDAPGLSRQAGLRCELGWDGAGGAASSALLSQRWLARRTRSPLPPSLLTLPGGRSCVFPHLGTVFAVCLRQLIPAGALGRCQALTDICPSSLAAGTADSSGSPREGQAGTSPSCVPSVGSQLSPERASGCPRARSPPAAVPHSRIPARAPARFRRGTGWHMSHTSSPRPFQRGAAAIFGSF